MRSEVARKHQKFQKFEILRFDQEALCLELQSIMLNYPQVSSKMRVASPAN